MTVKLKTETLSGRLLDAAVALVLGATDEWRDDGPFFWRGVPCIRVGGHDVEYSPSTIWDHGGPLAQKHQIGVVRCNDLYFPKGNEKGDYYEPYWKALAEGERFYAYGPTQLIAIMRCLVADHLGPEVTFDTRIFDLLNKQC